MEFKSFQAVKTDLLETFSTEKTEAKIMKKVMKFLYCGGDIKEFFVKENNLYNEANVDEESKLSFGERNY